MHAQLKNGSLRLRMGTRFGAPEAERACEAVRAFAPLRQLTLDFADVGEFEQSACAAIAKLLSERLARKVVLLGVAPRHSRLLRRLGGDCASLEPGRT